MTTAAALLTNNARDVILIIILIVVVLKVPILILLTVNVLRSNHTTAIYREITNRFASLALDEHGELEQKLSRVITTAKDELKGEISKKPDSWREGAGVPPIAPASPGG